MPWRMYDLALSAAWSCGAAWSPCALFWRCRRLRRAGFVYGDEPVLPCDFELGPDGDLVGPVLLRRLLSTACGGVRYALGAVPPDEPVDCRRGSAGRDPGALDMAPDDFVAFELAVV